MRPPLWQPAEALSRLEQTVLRRIRRAKLFVFLRLQRHTICDEAFQEELATLYADRPKGHPPVPPALLALATILQAYTGVGDAEAVEATVMDRRWRGRASKRRWTAIGTTRRHERGRWGRCSPPWRRWKRTWPRSPRVPLRRPHRRAWPWPSRWCSRTWRHGPLARWPCAAAWRPSGALAWRILTCATGARAAPSAWTGTSGTCCATWTAACFVPGA